VLRERLNRIQIAGVVLSLIAIALFNHATVRGVEASGLVYALVPVALWGASGLLQKISTNFIAAERSTFWFLAAFVPVAGVLLLQDPLAAMPAPRTWIILAALGIFFSLGNYAILLAFSLSGKASVIAPVAGLYPVVSVPIAIAFLGERVSQRETLGIAIALISAVALAWERTAAPHSDREPS
jgi:drug/metabolite transporter (DMT)-like permease